MKANPKPTPPLWAVRLLHWYCAPHLVEEVEGDLREEFDYQLKQAGLLRARLDYARNVFGFVRPFAIKRKKSLSNHNAMIRSYFKIGWRNLLKNKGYSFINIGGLAAGMTIAILIGLWMADELSFDSYYQNHSRLAEVMLNQTNEGITYTGPTISPVIADPLRTRYGSDLKSVALVSWDDRYIITKDDKKIAAPGIWVQHDFPSMFTLAMVSGSRNALKDPSTILISRSLAKSIFGDADPLGKGVVVNSDLDLIVGGVYEDMPHNTTFYNMKILLPWDNKKFYPNTVTDWDNHLCRLFVQLNDQAGAATVTEKIKNLPTPYIKQWKEEIMLQPLDQVHLYSEFENGQASGGRIQFVWLFGFIGVFVLLLACINFMNLSTARSEQRAKEVGIRKSVGSMRNQLVGQFLTESIVVALASLILSIMLVQLALPFFNSIAEKEITIQWNNIWFWITLASFALFSGVISGSYPAFYLSAFKPVKVLKGTFRAGRLAALPRKVLVVIQFTVSITLIICTLIVFQQIQFAKDRPVGYSRNGLITIPINTPELQKHAEAIRSDLMRTGLVKNMALSSQSPAHFNNNNSIDWPGKDPSYVIFFRNVNVTPEFGETIGWTISEGRDFSKTILSDSSSVILNETGARITKLKNPIGETIQYFGKEFRIIGIAKDMLTGSPYEPIEPAVFFMKGYLGFITICIKEEASMGATLSSLEQVFKKHNPNSPFEYTFVDQQYGRKFADEERIGNLSTFFALLAVFISCLGLFGLASFVAEQRTKEIGIRKVLGATVASLWQLMSKDFVLLVGISFGISIPASMGFMHEWLQHYHYRTTLSWYLFVLVGVGALSIALVTVSFQAIKAAITSPVRSLRSE